VVHSFIGFLNIQFSLLNKHATMNVLFKNEN